MHRTLFIIPDTLFGFPVFGFGLALAVVVILGALLMFREIRRVGWNEETRGLLVTLGMFAFAFIYVLPMLEVRDGERVLGLAVRGYGVFMLMGIVSGVSLAAYRAKRYGLNPEIIFGLAMWTCALGLLGARTFYVIQNWPTFWRGNIVSTLIEIVKISEGGLVVYGSFIGGIIGALIFSFRHKLPALALMDLAAPSLMLGVAFGRLGCLMNGCCFGGVCDADLPSIRFPMDSPAYAQQAQRGMFFGLRLAASPDKSKVVVRYVAPGSAAAERGIKADDVIVAVRGESVSDVQIAESLIGRDRSTHLRLADGREVDLVIDPIPDRSLRVHPVQFYSSIDGFLLCIIGLAFAPFRRRDGEVVALCLSLYAITRFLEEVVRDDQRGILGTDLSIGQVVSLGMIAAMIVLLFVVELRPRGVAFRPTS